MSAQQIENTIPVLSVRDLDRSLDFYKRILGFEMEWRGGKTCAIARDNCSIMLQRAANPSSGTVWVGLVDDSIYASIGESDVTVLQPPTNQPWAYEMKIADPDGNVVWLGAAPRAGARRDRAG